MPIAGSRMGYGAHRPGIKAKYKKSYATKKHKTVSVVRKKRKRK